MFTAKILITFAGQYMISDSRQSGCSIEYFFAGDDNEMSALASRRVKPGEDSIGMRRAKANLPYESLDDITWVPSLYEGYFDMKVGSDGKPVQVLKSFKPIEGSFFMSFTPSDLELPKPDEKVADKTGAKK